MLRPLALALVLLAGCAPASVPTDAPPAVDATLCAGCSAVCFGGAPSCTGGPACAGCGWDCPPGTAPGCGADPLARCFRADGSERMWSPSCVR